jgi:hypothetical protein
MDFFLGETIGKLQLGEGWIIPVSGRVLQWNFPFFLEKSFIEHVLTLSRSK